MLFGGSLSFNFFQRLRHAIACRGVHATSYTKYFRANGARHGLAPPGRIY
jgi:hypothetical protein